MKKLIRILQKERLKTWGSKIVNNLAAGVALRTGDLEEYENRRKKAKESTTDFNARKEEKAALENELYNRDISENSASSTRRRSRKYSLFPNSRTE